VTGSQVYVPCRDGIYSLTVIDSVEPSFKINWHTFSFNSGPPIVAGGAVWSIDIDSGILYAFNPDNGSVIFSIRLPGTVHFETPSAGDGYVFVGAGDGIVAVSLG
jgi:outer membrane protein assembly factor BamB